jgi:hypothetical protein
MRKEIILLIILFVLTAFIRFDGLGFSTFVGDETKTIFLRKDQSIFDFLMDQRKGPVQFLIVWFMEKLTNSYDEFLLRLPFAILGVLVVFAFYYFLRYVLEIGFLTSYLGAVFMSLNGIYIAFSRTAQYQMAYVFFAILFLIFSFNFVREKQHIKKKFIFGILSVITLALSFLSHYDAIFFLIPALYLFRSSWKKLLPIIFMATIISGSFYMLNIYFGYFEKNTIGYLEKRISGEGYENQNSLATIDLYNPLYIYPVTLFLLSIVGLKFISKDLKFLVIIWFLFSFIFLQIIMKTPGTHIHNYFVPLFILAAIGSVNLVYKFKFMFFILTSLFIYVYFIQLFVFVPRFNNGYPYKESYFFDTKVNKINLNYNLPQYGFVYDRSWREISDIMKKEKRVPNFYTNDNKVVSEYYLHGYYFSDLAEGFRPAYYIEIDSPSKEDKRFDTASGNYELLRETSDYRIYRLIK